MICLWLTLQSSSIFSDFSDALIQSPYPFHPEKLFFNLKKRNHSISVSSSLLWWSFKNESENRNWAKWRVTPLQSLESFWCRVRILNKLQEMKYIQKCQEVPFWHIQLKYLNFLEISGLVTQSYSSIKFHLPILSIQFCLLLPQQAGRRALGPK